MNVNIGLTIRQRRILAKDRLAGWIRRGALTLDQADASPSRASLLRRPSQNLPVTPSSACAMRAMDSFSVGVEPDEFLK
jgi:hypothetical protein